MAWEISGETGKKFGPDRRLASEVSRDVSLAFEALQPDRASWSVSGALANVSDLALPEVGEELIFYRSGVRRFRGIVTSVPVSISGADVVATVTAEGAHWWLEKTPLAVPEKDADGTTQDRAKIVFLQGPLLAHFERLFSLAQAAGLPVALGEVAELYDVPQVTVSEGSFADALAELVRLVPDAMTWWDYSGEIPAFRIARRGSAEALELAYGGGVLESARLAPRLGLETEEVVVQYVERGLDGAARFREQRSGSGTPGRRQVLVTSGETLADILPPDPIERASVTTANFTFPNLIQTWDFHRTWLKRFGASPSVGVEAGTENARYSESTPLELRDLDGNLVTSGRVLLTPTGRPADWLIEALDLTECRYTGTMHYTYLYPAATSIPEKVSYVWASAAFIASQSVAPDLELYFFYNLDLPVWVAPDALGDLTDVDYFKPLAYQFTAPPPGFADALRRAQGFVPYEGDLSVVEALAGGVDALGKVINVSNALDEWRNARALVQGVELSLGDGRQTIRCGAPQRLSFQDIVSRLRSSSRDNVAS